MTTGTMQSAVLSMRELEESQERHRLQQKAMRYSLGLGVILGFGTLQSGIILSDVLLVVWTVYTAVKYREIPPWWGVAIAAAVWIGAIGGALPIETLWHGVRILALATMFRYVRREAWNARFLVIGVVLGLLVQTVMLSFVGWTTARPRGLSLNASQTGETGWMAWVLAPLGSSVIGTPWAMIAAYLTAVIHMGTSGSRAALIGLLVWTIGRSITRFSMWRVAGAVLIIGAAIVFAILQGQAGRFFPSTAAAGSVASRSEIMVAAGGLAEHVQEAIDRFMPKDATVAGTNSPLIAATSAPVTNNAGGESPSIVNVEASVPHQAVVELAKQYSDAPPEYRPAYIDWNGYGIGGYVVGTGLQRPHNIPVLMAYEMGLLAVIPTAILVWAVWTRRAPLALVLSLLVVFLATEEWTARPEGHYMLAAMFGAHASAGGSNLLRHWWNTLLLWRWMPGGKRRKLATEYWRQRAGEHAP